MKTQEYIDGLFQDYEDTPELRDLKEEIAINLQERIEEFQRKGLAPDDAFEKAVAELGDVTAVADQISREKRNEVIGRMYLHSKTPLSKWQAIGYAVSGGVILFGLIAAFITYFATGEVFKGVATLVPFIPLPAAALIYLRLTQETARNLPMPWKRALIYALVSGVILFGLITSVMLYFMEDQDMQAVLGTLIPFVVPELCLIAFLVLTEKKRYKPWVLEEEQFWLEQYAKQYGDAYRIEQRGLLSGSLWLFAVGLFVTLGFVFGFQYSWVIFLFAVAGELLIEFRERLKG